MRINRLLALGLFALPVLLSFGHSQAIAQPKPADAAPAAPASAPVLKIAILDDQKLLSESKAAKSVNAQLDKKRESLKNEFAALEKDLNDRKKKLDDSKDKMKPEEFEKQRASFEADFMDARTRVRTSENAMEKAASDAARTLRADIAAIVADMAHKNGYNLVLTRQNVVLGDKDLDITDDVLTQLDKTVTDIPVNFDTAGKDAAKAGKAK